MDSVIESKLIWFDSVFTLNSNHIELVIRLSLN